MSSTNLLELISKNPEHAFHNVLKINSDYTKITTFCGKERVVYTKDKSLLEVLGRQIFVDTYLKDEKSYYLEEEQEEDGCRSDLLTKIFNTEQKQNVIEIKAISSNNISLPSFNTSIDDAFSQVKNKYLNSNGDAFVSVVLLDVEKIVENPMRLEKFKTASEHNKRTGGCTLFKKHGVYIITKKYLKSLNNYEDTTWHDIPKHCIIEVNREEKMLDEFRVPQRVANIKDAILFPTASSSYGIKNVRDVKDPEEDEKKKDLLISIFKTCLKAFEKKDYTLINKRGKEKDFVYIKNETFIHHHEFQQKSIYVLTTMNGAIVDGQNSIDCFKKIMEFLNVKISYDKTECPSYYKKLSEIVNQTRSFSERDYKEFKTFVESIEITIKPTPTESVEDAINIAINKNNTMPVTDDELEMSQNMNAIQIISNDLLLEQDLIIGYPKKSHFGVSELDKKEKYIEFTRLANVYQVFDAIRNKDGFKIKDIYNFKNKITKKNNKSSLFKLIKDFSEEVAPDDSAILKDIEKEISDNRKDKKRIKETIEAYNLALENGFNENIQNKLDEANEFLIKTEERDKIYLNKKRAYSILHFIPKDTKMLANIMKAYLNVNLVMRNIDKILSDQIIIDYFNKKSDLHKESIMCYALIICFYQTSKKSFKTDQITIPMIEKILQKLIEGHYKVEIIYNISVTVLIRNEEETIMSKGDGTSDKAVNIVHEYFGLKA